MKIIQKTTKICILLIVILSVSCGKKTSPKPEGYVRLSYPEAEYEPFQSNCPFTFEISNIAVLQKDSACWHTIYYPDMKARLYITYYNIQPNNLASYIKQSERLVYEHTVKASGIDPKRYKNPDKKVYGTMFELTGESATNFQFYMTDSAQHFIQGSFYFKVVPKPDSLQPAVDYIKKDLYHIIETTEWK